jgi:DNA topoisomerase-1
MDDRQLLTAQYLAVQFGGGNKKKWTTLKHNGVMFPPPYVPHKVPLLYEGQTVELDPENEEVATLYAKFTDSEYIKESIFRRNFWHDWKKMLGKDHVIKSLDGCDFSLIYKYLLKEKERKKLEGKSVGVEDVEKYKWAEVDGIKQPVGNFRVESAGIFLGRGNSPILGRVKRRIYPEDIIINIGKDEPIPEIPDFLNGHKWKKIIHDNYVEWIASWIDQITGKTKYIWLGSSSSFKTNSDIEKYDLARKLKKRIKTIRAKNEIELKSDDMKMRQIATAFYFIDRYALRVGNEKGENDKTADTVGVTSLRRHHIELLDEGKVKLDFLAKDSIRFHKLLTVDNIIYNNLKLFIEGKDTDDQLFDLINSGDVNNYLKTYMPKLTAKVFRTYNASYFFQKELDKVSSRYDNYNESDKINILLDEFNKANLKIATICHHKKNVNKSNTKQIDTINKQIKTVKAKLRKEKKGKKNIEKIDKLKSKLKKLKSKKEMKIEMKDYAMGTSKTNYIDPRITVAFLKKHNIDVNKIFPKTLQDRFNWAFSIDETFKF